MKTAIFRFYEELNDFLPHHKRKKEFTYEFNGSPGIKDAIEANGIPHAEVDLVLVNGESTDFSYQLREGDRVSVYPVFESFDITSVTKVREAPLRTLAFIVDVNLGKLARYLRMLGLDTLYRNDYEDVPLARLSAKEKRVLLTRDKKLLQNGVITHGYWLRSCDPIEQMQEIIQRFDLKTTIKPFSRCLECNGQVHPVEKEKIRDQLQPGTEKRFEEFYRCDGCEKIYWKGSHFQKMEATCEQLLRKIDQ